MKYGFRVKHDIKNNTDLVEMKCLNCDHEEEAELSILLELSEGIDEPSPVLTCPHCNHDLLVPKDVYDQIKGNFIYKATDK